METRSRAQKCAPPNNFMNINLKQFEVWFVTGSQHLYGPETLK
jgi:hypothetical protein